MNDGISIMDLGLEDYRIDLLKYLEEHPELEKVPRRFVSYFTCFQ